MGGINEEISLHEIQLLNSVMEETNRVASTLAVIAQNEAYAKVKMAYFWLTKLKFEIDNTYEYRSFKHSSNISQNLPKSRFMQDGGLTGGDLRKVCYDNTESLINTLDRMIHSSVVRNKT